MTANFGKITAHLAEPINNIPDELTILINQNINPPVPVTATDIYVRAMFVVSDEINSFGGRFPVDEHARLAALLIDSPVLVGHRKDKLPIGRNFHAIHVTKDGRQWIKCFFYWLKSAEGAESLRENIDGGIYKECSIGFTYLFPECSECGDDIRRCDHEPLSKSATNTKDSKVHFNYRKIERVLETSLVYRGALPDTSVSKDLARPKDKCTAFIHTPSQAKQLGKMEYQIEFLSNPDTARITLSQGGLSDLLILRHFNLNRLRHGARFVTDVKSGPDTLKYGANVLGRGEVTNLVIDHGIIILDMNGLLEGRYGLRPEELEGETRFLFYKTENQETQNADGEFGEFHDSQADLIIRNISR